MKRTIVELEYTDCKASPDERTEFLVTETLQSTDIAFIDIEAIVHGQNNNLPTKVFVSLLDFANTQQSIKILKEKIAKTNIKKQKEANLQTRAKIVTLAYKNSKLSYADRLDIILAELAAHNIGIIQILDIKDVNINTDMSELTLLIFESKDTAEKLASVRSNLTKRQLVLKERPLYRDIEKLPDYELTAKEKLEKSRRYF